MVKGRRSLDYRFQSLGVLYYLLKMEHAYDYGPYKEKDMRKRVLTHHQRKQSYTQVFWRI